MAKLTIRGHATRGEEVIKILEMLGGSNKHNYSPAWDCLCVYIGKGTNIITWDWVNNCYEDEDILVFTLEEFLEKFPYKVGDKVYYENKVCDVIEMIWNSNLNTISYGVYDGKMKNLAIIEELKPYKEETMEKTIKTITIEDFMANTKEWLIDTLESMSKDDALQTICDLHDELQKLQSKEDIKDSIARNAASGWCRCFKCDKIIRDTNAKCDKDKLITCHQWYDGYRTALLALGDERCKEMYK